MNIMERLGTKLGPLPVWAWGGIGAVVVWFLVGRGGTPAGDSLVGSQFDTGGGGAGAGPDVPQGGGGGASGGPPDPIIASSSGSDASYPQDTMAPASSIDPRNLFGGAPGPDAYAGPVDPFGNKLEGVTPEPELAPAPTPTYNVPDVSANRVSPILSYSPPEIQAIDTTAVLGPVLQPLPVTSVITYTPPPQSVGPMGPQGPMQGIDAVPVPAPSPTYYPSPIGSVGPMGPVGPTSYEPVPVEYVSGGGGRRE